MSSFVIAAWRARLYVSVSVSIISAAFLEAGFNRSKIPQIACGKTTAAERPNPTASVAPAYDTTTHIPSPWLVTATPESPLSYTAPTSTRGRNSICGADIAAGADSSLPDDFVDLDGVVYFSARDADHGRELWRTDGTPEGTSMVALIRPLFTSETIS